MDRASTRVARTVARSQVTATKQSADAQLRAERRLQEQKQKLVIRAIKDEQERRIASVNLQYRLESKRLDDILRARVRASQITEREYKKQRAELDKLLDAARETELAQVRGAGGIAAAFEKVGKRFGLALGAGAGLLALNEIRQGFAESISAARDWEQQLKFVQARTELSRAETVKFGEDLLEMAGRLGVPQERLAEIAETAGELGIRGSRSLLRFVETAALLERVTDLGVDQATADISKLVEVFDLTDEAASNLGSTINGLSSSTAANASELLSATRRAAAASDQFGLTADQVLALTAALIAGGVEARTAGTSLRSILLIITEEAERVAKVAGVTEQAFREMIDEDPIRALQTYLDKLADLPPQLRAIEANQTFGRENVASILTLANAQETVNGLLQDSARYYRENTSLSNEFRDATDSVAAQYAKLEAKTRAAATTFGQRFLPAIAAVLGEMNALTASIEEQADELARVDAKLARLDGAEKLLNRYKELTADGVEPTTEETEELARVTEELDGLFPDLVTTMGEAGGAMDVYTDAIERAISAQRRLLLATRSEALKGFAEDFTEQLQNLRRGRGTQSAFEEALVGEDFGELDENTKRLAARRLGKGIEDIQKSVQQQGQRLASSGITTAEEAEDELATLAGIIGGALSLTEDLGEQARAEIAKALNLSRDAVDELIRLYAEVPTPGATDGDGTTPPTTPPGYSPEALSRAEQAERELAEKREELRIDAIENEAEREEARIRSSFEKEKEAVEKLLALRLAAGALSRAEYEAELGAFTAALDAAADRAVGEDQAKRAETAAKEAQKLQERLLKLDRDRADAEVSIQEAVHQAALENIRDEFQRRAELLRAEAASKRDNLEIEASRALTDAGDIANEEERAATIAKIRAELAADLLEVDRDLAAALGKVWDEQADEQEKRAKELRDEVLGYTRQISDALVDALTVDDNRSAIDLQLDIAGLDEEEDRLRDSLRSREIDYQEYSLRIEQIAQRRADAERDLSEATASRTVKAYRATRDAVVEIIKEQVKEEIAQRLAALVFTESTEAGKTASVLAGAAARIGALASEAAAALASAATAIYDAGAKIASGIASALGPLAPFAIPAALAALTAAFVAFRDDLGFVEGGHVTRRKDYRPGGPVRGPGTGTSDSIPAWLSDGEFVHTAKATQRAGADNLYRLMHGLESGQITRRDLDEWLGRHKLASSVAVSGPRPAYKLSANDLYAAAGFASGGFVDTTAFVAAPSSSASYDFSRIERLLATQNGQIADLTRTVAGQEQQISVLVGRRTQDALVRGGRAQREAVAVTNPLRARPARSER